MRQTLPSRAFAVVSLIVGLGVLLLLFRRFGLVELSAAVSEARPGYLLLYGVFACVVRVGYSARWRLVARTMGSRVPLARLVPARLAGDAVGALLPSRIGGDPVRAALLYTDGVEGAPAIAGVAIDRIMEVIGNVLCAVAYVTAFSLASTAGARPAATVVLATLVLLGVALAVPLTMLQHGRRPFEPLYRLLARRRASQLRSLSTALQRTEGELMRFFREHPGTFIRGLLGSLLIEGLIIFEYRFLLAGFGAVLDLPALLLVLVAGGLARAVPTPAGLGALEASQVGALGLAMGRPDVGFVVGIVLRLHETLWISVGLSVLLLRGALWSRLRLLTSAGQPAA